MYTFLATPKFKSFDHLKLFSLKKSVHSAENLFIIHSVFQYWYFINIIGLQAK